MSRSCCTNSNQHYKTLVYGEIYFSSCHERRTKKKLWVPMRNQTSDPRTPRSDAQPLSHRDFTVSEVYCEVYIKRVLNTARTTIVDSVMFVKRIREMVSFELGKEIVKDIFRLVTSVGLRIFSLFHARDKTKISFTISLPSSKLTIFFVLSLVYIYTYIHICPWLVGKM